MDPIGMASSALQIIAAYKKKIDEAKLVYEDAKQLLRAINIFEVTVSMIPPRGDRNEVEKMTGEKATMKRKKEKGKDVFKDAAKFIADQVVDQVSSAVSDAVEGTSLGYRNVGYIYFLIQKQNLSGTLMDFASFFEGTHQEVRNDDDEDFKPGSRPAEVMESMRKKGIKDLEITFVGMAFIIQGALKVIRRAIETINKIQEPSCIWALMPWKVQAQSTLGNVIDGHFETIHKYNTQLLNAISIASYAVNLESLENVLNASNIFVNSHMRNFWRKRIGIDKTRCLMSDVATAFLEEMKEGIINAKANSFHLKERVLKHRVDHQVCLSRILSNLWNGNGDEWATVYELNDATRDLKGNALEATLLDILAIENAFCSSIKFTALKLDKGADGILFTADDKLEVAPKGEVVVLRPFDRLVVVCSVPCFDPEIFTYDCVCLMRYDDDPTKGRANQEFRLEELRESRAYLDIQTMKEFYGDDDIIKWNAPINFKSYDKEKKKWEVNDIKGFKHPKNFESSKVEPPDNEAEDAGDEFNQSSNLVALFNKGGITHMKTILYTPTMFSPGHYTVRLCLDDLDPPEDIWVHSMSSKKLILSPKSYYYDRSIDELQEGNVELSSGNMISSSKGIGIDNFKLYCELMGEILKLSIDEAKRNRDANLARKYTIQMADLLTKQRDEFSRLNNDSKSGKTTKRLSTWVDSNQNAQAARRKSNVVDSNQIADTELDNLSNTTKATNNAEEVRNPINAITSPENDQQQLLKKTSPENDQQQLLKKFGLRVASLSQKIEDNYKKYLDKYKDAPKYLLVQRNEASKILSPESDSSHSESKISDLPRRETACQISDLQKRETALQRLEMSFKILDLIESVKLSQKTELDSAVNKWLKEDKSLIGSRNESKESSTKDFLSEDKSLIGSRNESKESSTKDFLSNSDQGYKSLLYLYKLAGDLMPIELNPPTSSSNLIKDSPLSDADTNYVYDSNSGLNLIQMAVGTLAIPLLAKFFRFKQSAILVDAFEAVSCGHIARAVMLNSERVAMYNAVDAMFERRRKETEKGEATSDELKIFYGALTQIAASEQPPTDRTKLSAVADELITNLEAYADNILAAKNIADKTVARTVQKCVKLIDDVKNTKENAGSAPKEVTLSPNVKRSLGFLVVVEDCNALAWAESYSKPYQDNIDDDDSEESGKQQKLWRPLVYNYYPFTTIRNLFVNYNDDNDGDRASKRREHKLSIFAHAGKAKVHVSVDAAEKPKSDEVTKVGVFRVKKPKDGRDDISKETVCGWLEDSDGNVCGADSANAKFVEMSFPIPSAGETLTLDFTKLLEFDLAAMNRELNLSDEDNHPPLKYAVCFVCFVQPSDEKASEQRALCSKDDPKLLVTFDDQYEEASDADEEMSDRHSDNKINLYESEHGSDSNDFDPEEATGRFEYDSNGLHRVFVSRNGAPLCEKRHAMYLSDYEEGDYSYGWICNICDRHNQGLRWLCLKCHDDFCLKCACKNGPLLRLVDVYGTLKYSDCLALVEERNSRLPTQAEVQQELVRHGGRPLFPNEEMWWPISDEPDGWVSVGWGYSNNLGRTYKEIFGMPPTWSEAEEPISWRVVIAIVRPLEDEEGDEAGREDQAEDEQRDDEDDDNNDDGESGEEDDEENAGGEMDYDN